MSEFEPTNERGFYQTGSTQPPKSHQGLIAVLLILVILLCGAVTALGLVNIRLFRELTGQNASAQTPVSFSEGQTEEETTLMNRQVRLELKQIPAETASTPYSEKLTLQQIYDKASDSVVLVQVQHLQGTAAGTGVVFSGEGYIVTNASVVEGARSITVQLPDQQLLQAELVGIDHYSDLAVLYVSAKGLTPAEFGDSGVLQVGDPVVTLSEDIADARVFSLDPALIRTDRAFDGETPGGVLLNSYGQVIGINTESSGDEAAAVPSVTIKEVVDQLIASGFVAGRPTIGLMGVELSELYRHYYGWPAGIYVTELTENGPASLAGIEPGDIITAFGGTQVTGTDSMRGALFACEPGQKVTVTVYRDGAAKTLTLTVGQQ